MLRLAWLTTALAAFAVAAGVAQSRTQTDTPCPGNWNGDRDRAVYCETREDTFAGSAVDVDAARNGGIRVRGADRSDIRVTARIMAYADSEARARRLAEDVRIETGARVRATGPDTRRDDVRIDFPIMVRGTIGRHITTTLGSGGARIRAMTRNGGVAIERR